MLAEAGATRAAGEPVAADGEECFVEESLERIELKIAFLEQAWQELNDVVYRQQREIAELRARLTATQARLDALKSADIMLRPVEDERPPHY